MTRILFSLWLLSLGVPALVQAQDSKFGNAHIGLIYPISTNGTRAGEYTNKFSLHAIEGISKNETGFSLYGLVGIIKDSASGLQIAGCRFIPYSFFDTPEGGKDGFQITSLRSTSQVGSPV